MSKKKRKSIKISEEVYEALTSKMKWKETVDDRLAKALGVKKDGGKN